MIKRIEFSLNLEEPQEAHIYRALLPSLRYRRGGAIIRQALGTFFANEGQPQPDQSVRDPYVLIQEQAEDEQK
jgi:hypothetical protein